MGYLFNSVSCYYLQCTNSNGLGRMFLLHNHLCTQNTISLPLGPFSSTVPSRPSFGWVPPFSWHHLGACFHSSLSTALVFMFCINEVIWYLSFSFWFISFSMASSSFTEVRVKRRISFYSWVAFHWVYIYIYITVNLSIICWWTLGWFFSDLGSCNSAAVSTCVQLASWTCVFGIVVGIELLSLIKIPFFIFIWKGVSSVAFGKLRDPPLPAIIRPT